MARIKRLVSIVGVVTLFGPMVGDVVFGYSGGLVRNVTDLAPTCAGCHSSFTRDQLRNEPEAFAKASGSFRSWSLVKDEWQPAQVGARSVTLRTSPPE